MESNCTVFLWRPRLVAPSRETVRAAAGRDRCPQTAYNGA